MINRKPSMELAERVREGDLRAIARLITRVEANESEVRPALAELYPHTGRAHVVGITGVPGAGKSTLVTQLAREIRASGRTVGVVAIDPSSPFSGGSILGDRIRMGDLISDPGVFIRSMATRGSLGGLARPALDAVDLMDAGGFDVVLIETVGVGQDEVDIVRAAHTTVVVNAPGLGDDVQAIKAGVLEIADIHVVSKADRPDANRTIQELKGMLMMSLEPGEGIWRVPVIPTSSEQGSGFDQLLEAIDRHQAHLENSGELATRREQIASTRVVKIAEQIVRDNFARNQKLHTEELLDKVTRRESDPHSAAVELLKQVKETIHD
ncbi:methylmalonyl Co-A mutase-associated GTPase MeaB [Alkalilimnicola sp. S0819]|uniref:methylmalonyl Co-A mutase-associated GTPase MeaB n=1 Tax=Alkalilimnicola sp. S0819 TaxID=2613922 RepID=UPI0012617BDB|nr:methylmalonyl Co-A mutase-associated GTPase MeaB [Alkalilimnicola sp. S0819]KAB7622797.1 methylmalonyl Co-A mutase-associated GTPase MeaB [Alkalilimnicola sp. S0819]MPQ17293.1 methylmalonyl Co-A mutase-associated GTPase MeaB [Alkalilimnicola sp. S0819]